MTRLGVRSGPKNPRRIAMTAAPKFKRNLAAAANPGILSVRHISSKEAREDRGWQALKSTQRRGPSPILP